jgi:hypothetical protein
LCEIFKEQQTMKLREDDELVRLRKSRTRTLKNESFLVRNSGPQRLSAGRYLVEDFLNCFSQCFPCCMKRTGYKQISYRSNNNYQIE